MLKPGAFPEPWPSVFVGAFDRPPICLCRTAICRRRPCRYPLWVRCCARRLSTVGAGVGANPSALVCGWDCSVIALGNAALAVSGGVPFPPELHPAIAWLRAQPADGKSVVLDLAVEGGQWTLPVSGEILYGTTQHGKPAVSGVGSLWPHSVWKWIAWLSERSSPLTDPDLSAMLSEFDIEWILVHVRSVDTIEGIERLNTPLLEKARCFEPSTALSAWPYSICVLHVVE